MTVMSRGNRDAWLTAESSWPRQAPYEMEECMAGEGKRAERPRASPTDGYRSRLRRPGLLGKKVSTKIARER